MSKFAALIQVFLVLCLWVLLLLNQGQLRQSRRNTDKAIAQAEELLAVVHQKDNLIDGYECMARVSNRIIDAMINHTALPKQSEIDTCKALRMKP